jgi:FMN phosphatase YigB (HAD superfamily)
VRARPRRTGRSPPADLLFFDDHGGNVEGACAAGWVAEPYVDLAQLRRDLARHLG